MFAGWASRSSFATATMDGTTVYWQKNSRQWTMKAYDKREELIRHRPKNETIAKAAIEWAEGILRLELTFIAETILVMLYKVNLKIINIKNLLIVSLSTSEFHKKLRQCSSLMVTFKISPILCYSYLVNLSKGLLFLWHSFCGAVYWSRFDCKMATVFW